MSRASLLPLLAAALAAQGCDRLKPRAEQPPANAQETPPPTPPPQLAPAHPETPKTVALDLDGDGAADSARIAPPGEYAVSDGIAYEVDGTAETLAVNWKQDALVVKLSSGPEQAINVSNIDEIVGVRPGTPAAAQARSLGCVLRGKGQSLLAAGESGAILVRFEKGGLVAAPCGS